MKKHFNVVMLLLAAFVVSAAVFAPHYAAATLPSGNGQTTKAHSLSVAIASDQATSTNPLVVATPDHSADTSFSLAVWQRGSPTPGTSAVVADAAGPGVDATDPAAGRIVVVNGRRGALTTMGGPAMVLFARGGTSVVLQPWWYDSTLAVWFKFGATSTITLGTSNVAVVTVRNMMGAKFYIQIVTVTGTVTEVGYDIV